MSSKKTFREDYAQTRTLVKASKNAAVNAVRQSKALDLPVTYLKDDVVYEIHADGDIQVVRELTQKKEAPFTLVKGMILHGKKQ